MFFLRRTAGWSAPIHRDYTARQLYCPNASKNVVMRSNRFSLPRVKPCSTLGAAHQNGGACMSRRRGIAALVIGVVLGLSPALAHAGPCTAAIAQFEAAIRASAGNPTAGLSARQTTAAQLDRQPTAASIKQEEERLKSQFAATMARAKRLDARGDRKGCTGALNAARRMYIL